MAIPVAVITAWLAVVERLAALWARMRRKGTDKTDPPTYRPRPVGMILAGLMIFGMTSTAMAATTTVNLAWDANTETDLAGYKLYQGTSIGGAFNVVQPAIPSNATTTAVTGLTDGNWCWKLTAFDTANNESGFSNTVCFQSDTTPPTTPKTLRVSSTVVTP